jgi:uncharacterized protein YcbX
VASVSRLSITPVKGTMLHHPDRIRVERVGVPGNREFFFVDRDGRLFGATRHPALVKVHAEYDLEANRLSLRFPDGRVVEDEVVVTDEAPTNFWGRRVEGYFVDGPFSAAVGEYAGRDVRLVRAADVGGAFDVDVLTLLSGASVAELARQAGAGELDGRRFRMLMELDGCRPHEEDTWDGRRFRVGTAVIRVGGPVPRCVLTTRNPDTGVRDFDSLKEIKRYRGLMDGDGIPVGVYALVEEPGEIALGDELLAA